MPSGNLPLDFSNFLKYRNYHHKLICVSNQFLYSFTLARNHQISEKKSSESKLSRHDHELSHQ